ncbi:MAG: hypothetical protein WC934_04830 [Acidithiobacillus sp.]|jgi:hypothetical protein|uniref:hypothetical protein n=1 Tax=Acidithiobacillus sp. TaxID=1872118 RepID=UPI00355FDECD
MSDVEYCKKRIKAIDQWLDEYEGNDEKLIDKKLNEQENCLKVISNYRNALVNSHK